MSVEEEDKLERRLHKVLLRQGFRLRKSRRTGGYMIVSAFTNKVEAGELGSVWELDLDDVNRFTVEA